MMQNGDEPTARLFESIVVALPLGPGVLRTGLLPQRIQHRPDRLRAPRRQVTIQTARTTQRGLQPQVPVLEPVIPVTVRLGKPPAHFLRETGQVIQACAADRGGKEDLVSVVASVIGEH
jgi:hypothetical protein